MPDRLFAEIQACRICAGHLPLGPRPLLRVSATARLAVCAQAPGTRAHVAGLTFDDASGDRLRDWLGLGRAQFYDTARVAVVPMGFCYPGTSPRGGDYPPRPECAPAWRKQVFERMPQLELKLLVGTYAQAWHLGPRRRRGLTATVAAWRDYLPEFLPLPHPSWRNTGWIKANPWFSTDLLPYLKERVQELAGG